MISIRRKSSLGAILLLLAGTATSAAELSLTVIVTGLMPENEEPVLIKKATVRIESDNEPLERRTNSRGKASFRLGPGSISVIVTGQDTAEHWATGTCSVKLDSDLVVSFVLDLEESTRKCKREKQPSKKKNEANSDDDSKEARNQDEDSKDASKKDDDSKGAGKKGDKSNGASKKDDDNRD